MNTGPQKVRISILALTSVRSLSLDKYFNLSWLSVLVWEVKTQELCIFPYVFVLL